MQCEEASAFRDAAQAEAAALREELETACQVDSLLRCLHAVAPTHAIASKKLAKWLRA